MIRPRAVAFGTAAAAAAMFCVFCASLNGVTAVAAAAKVSLFKCCAETAAISLDNVCTVVNGTSAVPLRVPLSNDGGEAKQTYHADGTFSVSLGAPCPHGRYQLEPQYAQDAFRIDADTGRLMTADSGDFGPDQYCIEAYGFGEDDVGVYPCLPETAVSHTQRADTERLKMTVYSAVMILSVPFLIATFLVYACFWQLRNLHGKSLMCHVLSLTVAYLSLTYNQITNPSSDALCVSSGK